MANETIVTMTDGISPSSGAESAGLKPLSEAQLSLCLTLISLMGTGGGTGESAISLMDRSIYFPDSNGRMAIASELVMDDVPWLAGAACAHVRGSERMVHPSIAAQVTL